MYSCNIIKRLNIKNIKTYFIVSSFFFYQHLHCLILQLHTTAYNIFNIFCLYSTGSASGGSEGLQGWEIALIVIGLILLILIIVIAVAIYMRRRSAKGEEDAYEKSSGNEKSKMNDGYQDDKV